MSTLEVHRDVASLAVEWSELADRVDASPFLRPDWTTAWWSVFGRGSLEIVALRRRGRLSAVLPLHRHGGGLRSTTNAHTPHFGAVVEDGDAARALAEAVLERTRGRIELAFLDGGDLAGWRAAAHSADYRSVEQLLMRSPYLDIGADWGEYEQALPRSTRSEIGRRLRRLRERGELRLEIADGSCDLDRLLAEGFGIEGSGWKRERGTAIEAAPETARFYRLVARSAAERGCLRLAFLRLDDSTLAFALGLEHESVYHMVKSGYDPAFAAFAPGIILRYELVARAFAERLARFEFLGTDDPWKLIWTKTTRERIAFRAFSRSPRGTVEWAAFAFGRPMARRIGLGQLRRLRRRHSVS